VQIEYVPQLAILRELYQKPRDMERFRWYLQKTLGPGEDGELDVVIPMLAANPMGREHCLAAVEALLAIDADQAARQAAAEALPYFADIDVAVKLSVTLLDDVRGGWTNRWLTEAGMRMCTDRRLERAAIRRRRFVVVPCWVSETYTPERIGQLTKAELYRFARLYQHGLPRTLRDIMALDGRARAFAGERPCLNQEELEYTAHVLAPYMESQDFPVQFACLFGDAAAREAGYPPQGLSPYAGWQLALAMELAGASPSDA